MNINYLASGALNATYRIVPVQYYQYIGQINTLGTVMPTYADVITVNADVQLVDKQKLKQKDFYNETTIYKAFWVNLDTITGLNRNISSGGDYFIYNSLKYKVVGIENEFKTNWICVICAQGVASDEVSVVSSEDTELNNDQVIWTMITTYLADYYDSANVFLGYQNYYAAPVADEFIVLTKLIPRQRYTPNRYYSNTNQAKILWGYNDIEYQVDLYGTTAATGMDALYTILGSVVGSNFLRSYKMGIGKVGESKNLTKSNDRDNYMTRYTLLFTALANTKITVPMSGIGLGDITVNLKEYT